ncbi:hypothetical protein [Bradyrhizobium erythrophlei]|jgi:hypothetical protein|uniref:Uncharacterized protein n=1 Tax=Bradyrhizobium erythrophlei TaxID=1437360 RepID=A0A1M5GS13_9BRAD|nr:hypothetical protein [Bradyrhizobium erythrophlei]SHG06302.1 hypothetical protein SAMN05444169_0331 [Bradyrhizobium erythrophlei]
MSDSLVKVFAIFGFGVLFVTVILILVFVFPNPTAMQYLVMRIILALATASVATLLTGFITVEIPKVVKAGGAFAVFAIVFFYNPASLVVTPPSGALSGVITLGNQK